MPEIITVDFETEAIDGNPLVSPPSCLCSEAWPSAGVAVWEPRQEPWYETCTEEVIEYLRTIWYNQSIHLLFHNAPFDLSVAEKWLGLPWPTWERVHDTQYLVFLHNPYGRLDLKGAAEDILGEEPEERDLLHEWIMNNVPGATKKTAGAYTSKAPFELVSEYAIGDVVRTWRLYEYCRERDIDTTVTKT